MCLSVEFAYHGAPIRFTLLRLQQGVSNFFPCRNRRLCCPSECPARRFTAIFDFLWRGETSLSHILKNNMFVQPLVNLSQPHHCEFRTVLCFTRIWTLSSITFAPALFFVIWLSTLSCFVARFVEMINVTLLLINNFSVFNYLYIIAIPRASIMKSLEKIIEG